ncbi:hypothetical protein AAC387_Pa05g1469 [Persea americana]
MCKLVCVSKVQQPYSATFPVLDLSNDHDFNYTKNRGALLPWLPPCVHTKSTTDKLTSKLWLSRSCSFNAKSYCSKRIPSIFIIIQKNRVKEVEAEQSSEKKISFFLGTSLCPYPETCPASPYLGYLYKFEAVCMQSGERTLQWSLDFNFPNKKSE